MKSIQVAIKIRNRQNKEELHKYERNLIRKAAKAVLVVVGFQMPCHMDVSIVDNEMIREMNLQHRSINAATDVLSFPMAKILEGIPDEVIGDIDPQSGRLLLGDIIISLEMAYNKAKTDALSESEEVALLTVHGTLHLLGFDHADEKAEQRMILLTANALQVAGFVELAADL